MPIEIVLSENEEKPSYSTEKMIPLENGFLQVRQVNNQAWQIEKLVSTDPADYLKSQYQPGNILKHSPC